MTMASVVQVTWKLQERESESSDSRTGDQEHSPLKIHGVWSKHSKSDFKVPVCQIYWAPYLNNMVEM